MRDQFIQQLLALEIPTLDAERLVDDMLARVVVFSDSDVGLPYIPKKKRHALSLLLNDITTYAIFYHPDSEKAS
jgi:hypothetical protein